MVAKESETKRLQKRVIDLEQQLAEATAAIHTLQEEKKNGNPPGQQRTASDSLFYNEDAFRQALLAAPYPLMIWREDGKIMMVNATFTRISGYTLADIPTYDEWLHRALGDRVLPQPSITFHDEFPEQDVRKAREFEVTTRSGEIRIWDFSDWFLGSDAENHRLMLTMAVDITERRQIEEELEKNEEKFSIIFDKAPFAAALSKLPDGVITHINEEFERVFGYGRQEVIGKTSLEVNIHPDAEARARLLAQIQSQGNARNVEARLHTKSGEVRTFLLNLDQVSIGGEKYVLQTAQDITTRKQTEASLQEITHQLELDRIRLSTVLENLPVGVWISDQQGRLINKNEQADRIWAGNAPLVERIEEYHHYQSWYPGIVEPLKAEEYPLAIALRTGKPVAAVELEIRRFDGSEGTVLVSATPIRDDQGLVTGAVAVNMDITERKQAEQERRLAEARYTILFNAVHEGFAHYKAVFDGDGEIVDLQVNEINQAGAKISGVSREDQVGKTWRQVWPNVSEHLFSMYQRANDTGEDIRFDDHNNITGRIYDVLISRIAHGEFIVSFNDITERKQAEQELRDSEERFSKAFHKSPFGMNITRWQDGAILDVNDAWLRLLGWTSEEVLGKTTADIPFYVRPEDRQRVRERIKKEEVNGDLELELVRKDGSHLVVTVGTTLIELQGELCILGVLNDITDRKRTEEALRESEERYRAVMENALDAILVTDPAEGGRILSANFAALQMFGYTREEFMGLNRETILDLNDPRLDAFLQSRAETGEGTGVLTYRRRDGSLFSGELSAVFYRDQNGAQRSIAIIRDITERRKSEEALRESEQRYRGLFETMQEGLITGEVITDEQGNPVDYRYIAVNPAIERQYGIQRERFIGRTYTEVLPEGDLTWIEILGKVALTGNPVSVERYSEVSGKWFEAHAYSPRPGQFVNILTDITERKKAEESLRKSEERFSKAFRSSPDAIIISRLSDGLIIDVNEGWSELFGHEPAEVIGHRSLDLNLFSNPGDRQDVIQQIQKNGSVRNYELEIRRKSGDIRLASLSAEIIEVNDEAALLTSLRDITERKQIENALRASEAKMRAVFRALTEGVVFLNRKGEVEEANEAVELTFNHTVQELSDPEQDPRHRIVRADGTLFPVEEQPAMIALRTGETVRDVELGVPTRDGKISWRLVNAQPVLDENGTLLGVVASFFDITERRQAEQALRESEERFRSLANSMPQLVWTALPDGRVDYYNKRYLEYQEIKQINGEDWEWAPVLHPEDAQPTVNAWLHSLETGDIYQIEHRVRIADGSYRWHLSRGIPMRDEHGRIVRWFGTATDIHDLKVAEEKLVSYANRLERSNRELEQFAFMASHDLQEPLRKIEMFGNLLLERATSLQENERNYLDRMRNAAARMRDMIQGLLQLSRVATQGKEFVQVNLNRVIAEVVSDFDDSIRRTGAILDLEPLPTLSGDPSQLRQLFQNLIGNALKYHQAGQSPHIKIYAREIPQNVQIYVEDKGIGFNQDDADRIFQPFHRLVGRSQYEGSGIGLAICRRIVERHGGEIAAISEPGQGTTFIITLPLRIPQRGDGG